MLKARPLLISNCRALQTIIIIILYFLENNNFRTIKLWQRKAKLLLREDNNFTSQLKFDLGIGWTIIMQKLPRNSSLSWAKFLFLCLDFFSSLQNNFISLFYLLNTHIQFSFPRKLFCFPFWRSLLVQLFILGSFPLTSFLPWKSRPQVCKNKKVVNFLFCISTA